jgi:hypothetical protein
MDRRYRTEYELESLRRSLVMVETNQLALTRDQARRWSRVIDARAGLRRLTESRGPTASDRG